MPRRSTHLAVGILGSIACAVLLHADGEPDEARWWRVLGASGGGAVGSILPDLLEPSAELGPNHRGLMHSVALAVVGGRLDWRQGLRQLRDAAIASYRQSQDLATSIQIREARLVDARWAWVAQGALLGFAVGYGSHLLLDGGTRKSLPLLGLRLSA